MKLIAGVFALLAFFYLFYAGAMAAWSFFQMSDVVDQAFLDAGPAGGRAVRAAIFQGAGAKGVPIQDDGVAVSDDGRAIAVALKWTWPIVVLRGEEVVTIPLSLERAYVRP